MQYQTNNEVPFEVGDQVRKKTGYLWPGVIVAIFQTTAGKVRVVVECTAEAVAGALHIYSLEQIERDEP
jgi:hypothetical protein